MIPNRNVAGAVGGKTARPCENCLRRRARWFCPADDAFLCQTCDTSVHTANPLARRHDRVRLKTASFVSHIRSPISTPPTSWHCGFTRKARTPRHAKPTPPHHRLPDDAKSQEGTTTTRPLKPVTKGAPEPVVPELSADDAGTSPDENEEQLLYRVPIFDPFEATATVLNDVVKDPAAGSDRYLPMTKGLVGGGLSASCDEDNGNDDGAASGSTTDVHGTSSFLPSEMDLAEFAADVENLLGSGLEQECFGMDELGILEDCKDNKYSTNNYNTMESSPLLIGADGSVEYSVKDEEDDIYGAAPAREPFKLGFELHSADDPAGACGGVDDKSAVAGLVPVGGDEQMMIAVSVGDGGRLINDNNNNNKGSNKLLKLDYEAVITAWEGQGSPWTSGDRPEFNPDECWPDCMCTEVIPCGPNYEEAAGGIGSRHGGAVGDVDGGREARVSRYREKRRTRLFSKKIRYEVRKLNAEKRPRMKGRFVKRASVSGHALAPLPLNYIRK